MENAFEKDMNSALTSRSLTGARLPQLQQLVCRCSSSLVCSARLAGCKYKSNGCATMGAFSVTGWGLAVALLAATVRGEVVDITAEV